MKLTMELIFQYLEMCRTEKRLDPKTIKAYRIDLRQFIEYTKDRGLEFVRSTLKAYVTYMNGIYQPRTVKRKIASIRALNTWLENEDLLTFSPFARLRIKVQEPVVLPRTVSLSVVETMLEAVYSRMVLKGGENKNEIRDVTVMELLFATGIRVSELCRLNTWDLDLRGGSVRIYGKGARERMIQITNPEVLSILKQYLQIWRPERGGKLFQNRNGGCLSEASVRRILRKYGKKIGIQTRITPHMFRHTLATLLLEAGVDTRYIQQLLGHSSIMTTQIYTHVAGAKQRDILTQKHPRNRFAFLSKNWGGMWEEP